MPTFHKAESEQSFRDKYAYVPQGLGATKANLLRLLRSIDLVGWNTHEESGRLDRKAFTRYAAGSTAIFSKRQYIEAEKAAVSILIDCSGSMDYDNRIYTANQVAVQLARILEKSNTEFCVTGFFGNGYSESRDASGASKDLYYRTEKPVFLPFKNWNERLAKAATKMGSIQWCANGSTPDYSSITLKVEELALRNESRRILFIITDADGYDVENMKYAQKIADQKGVEIIAIGCQTTAVKQCFKNAESITRLEDLAQASFNKLLRSLS